MVRGTVNLPHGTGKSPRVAVFASGAKADEATAAGADIVGSDDLVAQIQGGFLDFDAAVATPDQMAKVGRIARILGPRGLMPNPKTGTVTMDIGRAVGDIKGGKINFRVDKQSNLHLVIGKASFTEQQLAENYAAVLDEIMRAKPSAAKGRYLQQDHLQHHDGPRRPGRSQPDQERHRGRRWSSPADRLDIGSADSILRVCWLHPTPKTAGCCFGSCKSPRAGLRRSEQRIVHRIVHSCPAHARSTAAGLSEGARWRDLTKKPQSPRSSMRSADRPPPCSPSTAGSPSAS